MSRVVGVPSAADLDAAAAVVAQRLAPTPLVPAPALGERVWLKLETQQPTGSFKVRGALAALAQAGGGPVVTASAGNAGLGVAWAATTLGVPATIVVPAGASRAKVAALRALAVTLVVEAPVLVAFARAAGWAGWGRALSGAVGVNVLTQPLLYAVATRAAAAWQLVGSEVIVVAVETLLLARWWRVGARGERVTLVLAVLATNAAASALGLLVL